MVDALVLVSLLWQAERTGVICSEGSRGQGVPFCSTPAGYDPAPLCGDPGRQSRQTLASPRKATAWPITTRLLVLPLLTTSNAEVALPSQPTPFRLSFSGRTSPEPMVCTNRSRAHAGRVRPCTYMRGPAAISSGNRLQAHARPRTAMSKSMRRYIDLAMGCCHCTIADGIAPPRARNRFFVSIVSGLRMTMRGAPPWRTRDPRPAHAAR